MSPSAALSLAREQIGGLYRIGDGWSFNKWSDHHRAWITPTNSHAYPDAQRYRRAAMVERAVRAMLIDDGVPEQDANLFVLDSDPCLYASTLDWTRAEYRRARA